MVRVGPWTFNGVERVDVLEHCQRCGTAIRDVWLCEVDAEHSRLEKLSGQMSWRIGSDCGPKLLKLSEEAWSEHAKPIAKRLALAKRLDALTETAALAGYELPGLLAERREALLEGTLDDPKVKHTGLVIGIHERALKRRK